MVVINRSTYSSTSLIKPALVAKWCCTSPSDTPAAAATPRIVVAAAPFAAKLRSAAARILSMLRGSSAPVRPTSDTTVFTVDNIATS